MTNASANRWVVVSAITVGGIYGYQQIKGSTQTSPGEFITAWGVVFFILALVATGAPGLAGAMALLVMTADLLANIPSLVALIGEAEGNQKLIPGAKTKAQAKKATAKKGAQK